MNKWQQNHNPSTGGFTWWAPSDRAFCRIYSLEYPCGYKWSEIDLNEQKYFGASTTYQKREFLHETGHALVLAHWCTADSISNNGASDCNNGKWNQITGWVALDRNHMRGVYCRSNPCAYNN